MRLVAGVAAVVLLAVGCTAPVPQPPPAGAGAAMADIRGSRRGPWGGAPAPPPIPDQQIQAGDSGVYIGRFSPPRNARAGISGILTSQIDKEQTSVRAYGWFGGVGEPVDAASPCGFAQRPAAAHAAAGRPRSLRGRG